MIMQTRLGQKYHETFIIGIIFFAMKWYGNEATSI